MSRQTAPATKQEPRSLKTKQWMDVNSVDVSRSSAVRFKEEAAKSGLSRTIRLPTTGNGYRKTHDSRQAKAKRAVHSKTTRGKREARRKPQKLLAEHKKRANQTFSINFKNFSGEFDPGSGRTLAACLTHASRTVER